MSEGLGRFINRRLGVSGDDTKSNMLDGVPEDFLHDVPLLCVSGDLQAM